MKKGLSVLLIAAALFGFYGGAVNLNDVLACKDYWEEEGERSTADMNKLEDGLNQLKDNEQAYLDGLDAVADGEEALAQGEQDYADGQATLAQGEADYAAAPGKLAAGEKELAAGKKKLADGYAAYNAGKKALSEGKEQLKGLAALIKGINDITNGYNEWKSKYDTLKDGRAQLFAGAAGAKDSLTSLAVFLRDEATQEAYKNAVNDVAADDGKQTADDYKDFIKSTNLLENALPKIQAAVKQAAEGAYGLYTVLDGAKATNAGFAKAVSENKDALLAYASFISDSTLRAKYEGGINTIANAYDSMPSKIQAAVEQQMQTEEVVANINALVDSGMTYDEAYAKVLESVTNGVKQKVAQETEANETLTNGKTELIKAVGLIYFGNEDTTGLKDVNETVNSETGAINAMLLPGLKKFNAATVDQGGVSPADLLKGAQDQLASGVQQVSAGALSSDTLKNAVKEKMGASAITLLSAYSNNPNPLNSALSDFAKFEGQMDTNPGLAQILPKAKALLQAAASEGQATVDDGEKQLKSAEKQLAQGEKDLAAGKKKLAQGYADYKAAPGKLAAGRAALAEGLQKLMDGRAELAAGKDKLAEYEDGEQQVRDGLATLMGTEANGGLTSILDRRSGDDDFDNGDTHLDLDEGLEAVTVGRGYQADSGELITKEITNRAIGTAAGLGAGALAVLAAILSFLKKNKGAGVSAILSAVAGGAGIAAGTGAGMEFSHIAGSAVGSTPWIAFGVLAGVALVHAIAHFASKEA